MSQVVVEEAHTGHAGSNCNTMGLPDVLLHVVLQLSGITGEDCELVEFAAVQERFTSLLVGSLVKCPVHCDPGILLMHFLDHLVPLGMSFADKKGAKQLVALHDLL